MGSLLQCLWLTAKGKGLIQFLQTSSKILPWAGTQNNGYFFNNKSSFWSRDYRLHETLAVSLVLPPLIHVHGVLMSSPIAPSRCSLDSAAWRKPSPSDCSPRSMRLLSSIHCTLVVVLQPAVPHCCHRQVVLPAAHSCELFSSCVYCGVSCSPRDPEMLLALSGRQELLIPCSGVSAPSGYKP